jgi:hypothetical protein
MGKQMSILQLAENCALQADLAERRISSIRDAQGHVNPAIIAPKDPLTPRLDLAQLGDMSVFLKVLRYRTAQYAMLHSTAKNMPSSEVRVRQVRMATRQGFHPRGAPGSVPKASSVLHRQMNHNPALLERTV